MAVREFDDEQGVGWRVWCITPEAIHPVTRAEDYLADCYQLGWLVFETTSGDRKKRLCPYPQRWEHFDVVQLQQLLNQAEVVPLRARHRLNQPDVPPSVTGAPRFSDLETPDLTDLTVVRTFRYPGGRFWTVAVTPYPEPGGAPVLRFTAGARSIDLEHWPKDWPDLPDDALIELLRSASIRAPMTYTAETPRRRYNDPPAQS